MDIRKRIEAEAQRLNKGNVKLAKLLESNFENVVIAMDVLNETDVDGNGIMVEREVEGETIQEYRTDVDFMVIESGNFYPIDETGQCKLVEQTTITFVSTQRPDILEDILTMNACAKECRFQLSNVDKIIQPLGSTNTDLTVVTATYIRVTRG